MVKGEMGTSYLLPMSEVPQLLIYGTGTIEAVPGEKYRHVTIDYQGDGRVRDCEWTVPEEMAYVHLAENKFIR